MSTTSSTTLASHPPKYIWYSQMCSVHIVIRTGASRVVPDDPFPSDSCGRSIAPGRAHFLFSLISVNILCLLILPRARYIP